MAMSEAIRELLAFKPDHLAWPLPDPVKFEKLPEQAAIEYLEARKQRIVEAEYNPIKHGYVPDIWETVDEHVADLRKKFPKGVVKIILWGGNRSSKTRKASNFVVRDIHRDGRRWWCCDSTESMSRTNQMRLLYEQMPPEWKGLERDQVTDMRYSVSDGFPKNRFVCPNRSEVTFKFYSMLIESLPGPELDGIWADELVPLIWVKTLIYRLINRNGILFITFTPELGWNETYGHFYEGAQIISETDAPLLQQYNEEGELVGYKKVPRVMQCVDPTARIIYFHTSDNPFGNYPALVQELKGKSEEEILIRAYGVCTKSHTLRFPMFSEVVHVITQAHFAHVLKECPKTMRFHLVDPCDGRNWFMIWVACPYPDKWIIYREWPSHGHPKAYIEGVGMPGPWALTGTAADGVMGPAQKPWGFSLKAYKDEILRQEGKELIDARYIDSRYATSPKSDTTHVTSLLEQMVDIGMDFLTMVPGRGKIVNLDRNDGSVDMINTALYYDLETDMGKFSPKLARDNEPQLQVLDTCPNTIYALGHFTGFDGQKGACKDPIDCIRGLFLSAVNYVDANMYAWQGGGVS